MGGASNRNRNISQRCQPERREYLVPPPHRSRCLLRAAQASDVSESAPPSPGASASPMPSARLEQEAQTLGFRDSAFPPSGIGSPQHMQMSGLIFCSPSFVGIQCRLHSCFPKQNWFRVLKSIPAFSDLTSSTMLDYDEFSRCFFNRLLVERARLTRCLATSFRACAGPKRGKGRAAWSKSRTLAMDRAGRTSS